MSAIRIKETMEGPCIILRGTRYKIGKVTLCDVH